MHYYKRHLGDYYKKYGRFSMLEHGACTVLIDACFDRERFPTFEDALEWTWASSEAEISAVKFVLSKAFTLNEDGFYISESIQKALETYQRNAKTNQKIAIKREAKKRENKTNGDKKSTVRTQVVNDSIEKTHEVAPNHKPLTTNHKPLTINQVSKECEKTSVITGLDFITESQWAEICKIKKTATKQKLTSRSETMLVNNLKKINEAGFTMEQVLNTWSEYPNWKTITAEYMQNQITGAGNGNSQGFNNSSAKQSNGQGRTIDVFDLDRQIFGGATSDT